MILDTAQQDGTAGANDVAGTHLSGDGSGQGLKGGQAPLLPAAPHIELPEHRPHPLTEAPHLHKSGTDGEIQARANEQEHQNIVRQIKVDALYHLQYRFHSVSPPCPL